MSDFIFEDIVHTVPIEGGHLYLSPAHDFLHHFERNGAWILKYWNTEAEPPRFNNVVMCEESARFLIEHCDIEVTPRRKMSVQEHEHYMLFCEDQMGDLDFEPSPDPEGMIE